VLVSDPPQIARRYQQTRERIAGVVTRLDEKSWGTAVPVPRATVEDAQYRSGPDGSIELRLRATRFEALRWRTGRRSRTQMATMDRSDDPSAVLDHRYLFGPADRDVVE
jgi:hypothetical protein